MSSASAGALAGVRVVVTRAAHQATALGALLEDAGARVIYMPAIAIADPESFDELDAALGKLVRGGYSWVVFTSVNAVTKLVVRLKAQGMDVHALRKSKVAAVGSSTAAMLERLAIAVDLVPETFTSEALAAAMGRGPGCVLLPRAAGAPHDVVDILRSLGWEVIECVAYRNVSGPRDTPGVRSVQAGDFDVVTFASPSAVKGFVAIAGTAQELRLTPRHPGGPVVACIGPATALAARDLGFRVDVVPDLHTAEDLVAALADFLS